MSETEHLHPDPVIAQQILDWAADNIDQWRQVWGTHWTTQRLAGFVAPVVQHYEHDGSNG